MTLPTTDASAELISVPFTYKEGGLIHNVDMTMDAYLEVLRLGEVDGTKICSVEVSETVMQSGKRVKIYYDFVLLNTGHSPWRMISI